MGGTVKEPYPGWVDNLGGPASFIAATGSGVLRTILIDNNAIADIIPADIVISTIIAAAWQMVVGATDTVNKKSNILPIYNCASGNQNPIKWKQFVKCVVTNVRKNPLENAMWYGFLICCNSEQTFKWMTYLVQHIPVYLIDFFTLCMGKKPR